MKEQWKSAEKVEIGEYIYVNHDWAHVVEVRKLITAVEIIVGNGDSYELALDKPVRYATGEEVEEGHRELAIRDGHEEEAARRSSQKGTWAGKNGLRRVNDTLAWVVAVLIGFVLSGCLIGVANSLGCRPWLQLAIGISSWVGFGWLAHDLLDEWAEESRLVAQLKVELRERNSEVRVLSQNTMERGIDDFVTGMNAAGVEIALGGADPFGVKANMVLKFPVTILHKHLVEAMLNGWEAANAKDGIATTEEERAQVRNDGSEVAWRWIREMTEGKR